MVACMMLQNPRTPRHISTKSGRHEIRGMGDVSGWTFAAFADGERQPNFDFQISDEELADLVVMGHYQSADAALDSFQEITATAYEAHLRSLGL